MTSDERLALIDQLIQHEGMRVLPYTDSVGKTTIGVGRNLSDCGISQGEARHLLDNDIDAVLADLRTFAWFEALDPVRQRVLANMRFNLGPPRFRGFTRMLRAVAEGEYGTAATAMLNSLWATQVGQRAKTLAAMMRSGQDELRSTT